MPDSQPQTGSIPPADSKREAREPRALSNEYHKARKQLMLWAGILFIWELVGIDLAKTESAEGNIGAIVRSIRSPQAVPWVLLILVAYFLFKLTIEWHQCSSGRRALRVARIDFFSAWVVASLAYALYVYQALSRAQFADVLQRSTRAVSVVAGCIYGLLLGVLIVRRWNLRDELGWKLETFDYGLLGILLPAAIFLIAAMSFGYLNLIVLAISIAGVASILFVILLVIDRFA